MRKKAHLLVMLLIFSFICEAQTFIPKIGFSRSNLSGKDDNYVGLEYKSGFIGGLAFTKVVTKSVSIQAEILYSQKGFKRVEETPSHFTSRVTLNYLQLPISLQYSLKNIFLFAGPTIAYGINGWVKNSAGNYESYNRIVFHELSENQFYYNFRDTENEGGIEKRWDFGIMFGLGIKIRNILVVDCRYDLSITNVFPKNNNVRSDLGVGGNRSFQIMVGMPIKKLKIGI